MKKFRNTSITNTIFIAISFICYIVLATIIYNDVGFYDWNFQNVLPTANVSPFMFFTLLIYLVLPKKIKKSWSVLISMLSFGMLAAAVLGCVYRAIIQYKFHFSFLLDYISHLSLSLLGVYLVKSKQITLNKKDCVLGGSLLIIVAFVMMSINILFGTAFFGLALNDKYNIYNMVLVSNCYLSALIYFIGLIFVLTLGCLYIIILNKEKRKKS